MIVCGLQKLTLLDYPGKVAATIFTGGCNLRCPFCQNAVLVNHPAPEMTEEEVLDFLRQRQGFLDGVAVTGGEPLLQEGLEAFLGRCRELGLSVKLDTNGCFPKRLRSIIDRGLVDYVAMDVKNTLDRYPETVGIPGFDTAPVEESIALLREGRVDWEFRTTVVREFHTPESIRQLAQFLAGSPRYFLQAFEDSSGVLQPGLHEYAPVDFRDFAASVQDLFGQFGVRGVDEGG